MADGPLAIGIDIGGTKVAGGIVDADGRVLARSRRDTPHRSTSPARRRGHHRLARRRAAGRDRRRDHGGRHRGRRVRGHRPRHRGLRTAPVVAQRAAARGPRRAGVAADLRRQRRQRRRVGRAPLRRRPRREPPRHGQPRHWHRRRHRARRPRHPRPLRHRRRVRAHAGRARRHPLRVRQQGLLGAVRLGQRARARGARR